MPAPIRKVVVANRGEIATRVFRTCREHGIATVAVYSDADRNAGHVRAADEARWIGGAAPAESYLNVERIVEAARESGADAIHPGYGFLSERPALARACEAAGVIFVGPPAHAMEVMGDKVRARQAMQAAGVPVVPGVDDLSNVEAAIAATRELGFPVMLKASAGGGGKGMRIVHSASELPRAFEAAAREATAAFGDGRLFLERAVLRARHVEIQVLADAHGQVLFLGERDCSVQRRHQKVVEESPSPSPQMTTSVRDAMGTVAVRAAAAVGYRSAGTVEFLFEETEAGARYYFLEMNTRLQVEHPVTEALCGRDLVWDQLRVAAGERLGFGQDEVELHGHAIECRVYAEDPLQYLPRPGRIVRLRWPHGAGIRVDTAVAGPSTIPSEYDPMIAKITVWGPDRAAAILRMRRALDETVVLGIETNLPFHRALFREPDFCDGRAVTTRYIEEHQDWLRAAIEAPAADEIASVVAAAAASRSGAAAAVPPGQRSLPWRTSARWRT